MVRDLDQRGHVLEQIALMDGMTALLSPTAGTGIDKAYEEAHIR